MRRILENAGEKVRRLAARVPYPPRAAEALSALKFIAGRRPALSGAVVAGAVVVVLAVHWARWLKPVDHGNPLEWTNLAARQHVADVLNESVTIEGFRARAHLVRRGENFWGIAAEEGVDIDTVIGCNPALKSLDAWIDQSLLLVNRRGCLHVVGPGESLRSIAAEYEVKPHRISAANDISLFGLRRGELIFIPEGRPCRLLTPEMEKLYARRRLFRSPLAGDYTSLMGRRSDPFTGAKRHHAGVDIRAKRGQLVGAAAAGKVTFAGRRGSYGKAVFISHGNGYTTVYGHLSKISVRQGQPVSRHYYIGRVGSTGRATGPHLHFEIRYRGKVQDPLEYLW